MTSASTFARRTLVVAASGAAFALVLSGCAAGSTDSTTSSGETIIVGTTDKVTTLDPAGSYVNGSFAVMNQVFPFLMNTP